MRPAAQLDGVVGNLHDSHDVAVLLAEEHHRAELPRLVDRRLEDVHGPVLEDELVHAALDRVALVGTERVIMREVEAQLVRTHCRAGLVDVIAEHLAKRLMDEMRAGVIRHRRETHRPRNPCADTIAGGEARSTKQEHLVVLEAIRVDELGGRAGAVVELDRAGVRHLSPARRVER